MAVQAVRDFTGRGEGAFRVRVEPQGPGGGSTKAVDQPTFGDLVKDFARDVNDLQFRAGDAVDLLATGKAADVHQVMIAVEEAGIALDLMLEIRNRVLEGYQELIRMQV
ncbi:MAG: flagellar hook-basal body complex protein FliE [Candidatus Latescibacterota bacterium]|jgi:flagellar hook-basal body complex protein FliE